MKTISISAEFNKYKKEIISSSIIFALLAITINANLFNVTVFEFHLDDAIDRIICYFENKGSTEVYEKAIEAYNSGDYDKAYRKLSIISNKDGNYTQEQVDQLKQDCIINDYKTVIDEISILNQSGQYEDIIDIVNNHKPLLSKNDNYSHHIENIQNTAITKLEIVNDINDENYESALIAFNKNKNAFKNDRYLNNKMTTTKNNYLETVINDLNDFLDNDQLDEYLEKYKLAVSIIGDNSLLKETYENYKVKVDCAALKELFDTGEYLQYIHVYKKLSINSKNDSEIQCYYDQSVELYESSMLDDINNLLNNGQYTQAKQLMHETLTLIDSPYIEELLEQYKDCDENMLFFKEENTSNYTSKEEDVSLNNRTYSKVITFDPQYDDNAFLEYLIQEEKQFEYQFIFTDNPNCFVDISINDIIVKTYDCLEYDNIQTDKIYVPDNSILKIEVKCKNIEEEVGMVYLSNAYLSQEIEQSVRDEYYQTDCENNYNDFQE